MTTVYVASTSGGSPTTPIVQQQWKSRANKATPILADEVPVLDSANSGNEVYSTFTQIISSLSLVTPVSSTTGNIPVWNGTAKIDDSGITVDHSQNLTNVGTINGIALTSLLTKSDNLASVANKTSSFNNISPLSANGDIIYFDGSNNVRLAAGTTDYVLTMSVSGRPSWAPSQGGGGASFLDNAIFAGTAGTNILISFTPVDLRQLVQSSSGNSWVPNSFTNMTCLQAGTFMFDGVVPVLSAGTSNYCYARFAKNGFPAGASGYVCIPTANTTMPISVKAIFTCAVNDEISLITYSFGGYSIQSTSASGSNTASIVSITRLN